ncbi:penicillin-binding protein [Bacteroides uniformis]|uniref:transglycosylase domain-containing protein n=2 Tax=Bacteroides uniformis TaxID=820 RepID=UPI00125E70CA|nr:transglycosylase domain-containing protein [Bacteroides uniformis]KAB3911924.1 penicillin-binding protein [Bacteroides uniformis]KAB3916717.1 penicillin-binding protein [Bacteroides uniformis]KAB3919335.1 penicillin-binding protein [Bacteroides uniformis]KAB3927162.1 penicillin-binding protein [Bacteroides uniformis]KAB3929153.1 penicillin-binding protein [Bacteroides uniformis]
MIRKVVKILWIFIALISLVCVFIFFSIAKGWIGYMPPVEDLENPNYKFATEVFSEDGKVLGTYSYSKENRVFVGYNDLSPNIINALIATEDVRFAEHSGIDAYALTRAVVKRGILMQKNAGGGSTITQQLSKQLYSPSADNVMERLFQKPIEWVIAVKLERYYTKEEILTMYLNKFDFLNNAVGIKTAAFTYFGCEPKDLKIEEAATLVGMCKNPSLYNPVRYNERSRGRRNVVLDQMRKAGYITEAERDSLQALPLKLKYNRVDHKEGLATYFREYLRGVLTAKKPDKANYRGWQMQKYYEDSLDWENNPLFGWCEKNTKKDGTKYNLYTDGLKIYTTLDSRMQQYAEDAVTEHLKELQGYFFKEKKGAKKAPYTFRLTQEQVDEILGRAMRLSDRYRIMKKAGATEAEIKKAFDTPEEMSVFSWEGEKDTIMTPMDSIRYYKFFLRAGFMSMDPRSGHVKAYVGGPNYHYFQYDMAMVGRRQVGSTIKPFLYTLAMENGFSPCDEVRHVEYTLIDENGKPWTPRNANKKLIGDMVTVKWGLANSDNWITAYLMSKLNPYNLKRLIHTFGVRNRDIVPSVSLCLGPCEISVGEMVSVYTAFPNKGIRVAPLFVTRIEDNDGNVLATFAPEMQEVISVSSAYKMLVMLRAVVNEGTGGRVRRLGVKADMGGKTGTTNYNADGWFMGFTPSLVSGCWVGGEDRDIHFDTMLHGQGASMALPIWTKYMVKVLGDKSLGYDENETFQLPEGYDPCKDDVNLEGDTHIEEPIEGLDELFN